MCKSPIFYIEESDNFHAQLCGCFSDEEANAQFCNLNCWQHPPGWYFWNEVWADCYGPFESEEIAKKECRKYAESL